MSKYYQFGEEAIKSIRLGIKAIADPVKITLGPKGYNTVLGFKMPISIVNDGLTIVKEISLEDKFQNAIVQVVKEAAIKTNTECGDASTSSIVLTEAIVEEGLKHIIAGVNPLFINAGIEIAVKAIIDEIKKRAIPVDTKEDIANVASIAANNKEIGKLISEIIDKVGRDGLISIEESKTMETKMGVTYGMRLNTTYISPYFITNDDKQTAILDDSFVFITDRILSTVDDILPVVELVGRTGKPLTVIAGDVTGDALALLIVNKVRDTFKSIAVKAPFSDEHRRQQLEDVAILTGAKFFTESYELHPRDCTLDDLGMVRKTECTRDWMQLLGGAGDRTLIQERIDTLKEQIKDKDLEETEIAKLKERLAKLTDGIGVLEIGGSTEAEIREKRLRVEDAFGSTKASIEEGIIPGGGSSFIHMQHILNKENLEVDPRYQVGVDIIKKAIEAPLRQIASNSGDSPDMVVQKVQSLDDNFGYDAISNSYVNMMDSGIIDAAKVVANSIRNSASIASLILSSKCIMIDIPDEEMREIRKYKH